MRFLTSNAVECEVADSSEITDAARPQGEYWYCASLLLRGGGATLVDSDVFESLLQWTWSLTEKNGAVYAQGPDLLHRMILKPGKKVQSDHRNGNGLDNRRKNLRVSNHQENQWNSGPRAGGKSKYKGVSRTSYGPWEARIRYGGKRHYLGVFGEEEAAARAYDFAAKEHHGEFAWLNFPLDVTL